MKTITLISLFVLSLTSGALTQEYEYSFMEEFPLSSGGQFGLSTSDGFIHVMPSDDQTVKVFYIVYKGDRFVKVSREELEKELDLEIASETDNIDIRIRNKGSNNWSGWKETYNVSCAVYVPLSTSCTLKSSDGDIRVTGLNGRQKCRTSDGDIKVKVINGDVSAVSSDGDVYVQEITGNTHLESSDGDLEADNVNGDVSFSTSDGDIKMYKVSGVIEASTSDGDISFVDCAGSFKGVTSDGDVMGNLLKLKGKLSVVTSDGDIDVAIPAGVGIDLIMKGEDLYLPKVELSGRMDEHNIRGAVNGGGLPVELITSDGTVKLSLK